MASRPTDDLLTDLPAPRVDDAWATRVTGEELGVPGRAHGLGSNQDANFVVLGDDGAPRGVLKVSNPAVGLDEVTLQDRAADLVAQACPDLRVAQVLRDDAGRPRRTTVRTPDGPAVARLIRHLGGGTLHDRGYLPPDVVARLGAVAARVDLALADLDVERVEGVDRALQWDPRHARRVLGTLGPGLPADLRDVVLAAADEAWRRLEPLLDDLPQQAVHLDLTDDNVVVDAQGLPDGVIDFGDVTRTWTVAEPAVAVSSVLHHPGAGPVDALPALRAYHALRPLDDGEVDAVWPVVVLRAAVLVASGCHQVALDGDNAYAETRLPLERRILEQALAVPLPVMSALVRDALLPGTTPRPTLPPGAGVLVTLADAAVLDLSSQSPLLDDGAWLAPDVVQRLAADAVRSGAPSVVTRFAEARLAGNAPLAQDAPAAVATGVDVWTSAAEELRAPWSGRVEVVEDRVVLRGAGPDLVLTGLREATDGEVRAGDVLGRSVPGERLRVCAGPGATDAPEGVAAAYAPGWLAGLVDPAPLLGLPVTEPVTDPTGEDALRLRERTLAEVQEHYYRRPPRIERGWRHLLATDEGRPLLDMVNNVAVVGHSHPRIAAVAERQLRLLNTNSRFHYAAVAELGARLVDLVPDPLDTVFLVNSGSEAVDLALRLAMVATDRTDVVAMGEAYHGWTYASDAVSTSIADNPRALETRPDWVHTVPAPNPYRGRHRGADAVRYGPEAARVVDDLAASGRPPAAFVAESFYGTVGGMALPDGYLDAVYSAVRRHGGLAIADEVQVGYGRLGDHFWGFEQQGVVPDVVAVAKAVGNGAPVGAVITTRAVADAYRVGGYFFSSTGGSPLSSRIALEVLDVVRDEGLQENARVVGAHLAARLRELGSRHRILGAVHGAGLYVGVELVRDRETLEPADTETAAICDRMLGLGVVVQPTSDRGNVLKVKPPLCLDRAGADFFVDTLDRVLTEGW